MDPVRRELIKEALIRELGRRASAVGKKIVGRARKYVRDLPADEKAVASAAAAFSPVPGSAGIALAGMKAGKFLAKGRTVKVPRDVKRTLQEIEAKEKSKAKFTAEFLRRRKLRKGARGMAEKRKLPKNRRP